MFSMLAAVELVKMAEGMGLSLVWAFVGILILVMAYKIFEKSIPQVDIDEGLNNGNMAIALVVSVYLAAIAVIAAIVVG